MGAFVTEVPLRWSDVDAFGHVNHAKTVTLLEQARVAFLFVEAQRQGLFGMAEGMVVARVVVDYHAPVEYQAGSLRVSMTVRDLRAASFTIDYAAHATGPRSVGAAVATAETLMVPYDLRVGRPRRIATEERAFLSEWRISSEKRETEGA